MGEKEEEAEAERKEPCVCQVVIKEVGFGTVSCNRDGQGSAEEADKVLEKHGKWWRIRDSALRCT